MTGEIVILLLIILPIIAVLISFLLKEPLRTRRQYLQILETAGYSVSSDYLADLKKALTKSRSALIKYPFISKWSILKDGIIFNIETTETGYAENKNYWFDIEFQMPSEVKDSVGLKIQRRGVISRVMGINRGEYNEINNKFSIIGSNIMLVKHILNNPKYVQELWEATYYGVVFDLNGKSKARIKRDIDLLVRTCNETIDVVNIFRDFVNDLKGEQQYTIEEILDNFNLDSIELTCIICYQAVMLNEALIFNCCTSVGHKEHLNKWLTKKTVCPYCRKTDFVLLDPITSKTN